MYCKKAFFIPIIACSAMIQTQAEISPACETAMNEYISLADALISVLGPVKDTATAESAVASLSAMLPSLIEVRKKINDLPPLQDADKAELERRYAMKMRTQWGEVFREIFRIQSAQCFHSDSFREVFTSMCLILR